MSNCVWYKHEPRKHINRPVTTDTGERNYKDIFPILQQMIYSICRNRQHLCFINNIQNVWKRIVKKCLTEKLNSRKKKHVTLKHLWLGNTCAVWIFPGGCSQASEAMIITKGDALKHNHIMGWYVIAGLRAAVWAVSLIYNDCKYFLCIMRVAYKDRIFRKICQNAAHRRHISSIYNQKCKGDAQWFLPGNKKLNISFLSQASQRDEQWLHWVTMVSSSAPSLCHKVIFTQNPKEPETKRAHSFRTGRRSGVYVLIFLIIGRSRLSSFDSLPLHPPVLEPNFHL